MYMNILKNFLFLFLFLFSINIFAINRFKLKNVIFYGRSNYNYRFSRYALFSKVGKLVGKKDIFKILKYLNRTKLFSRISIYKLENNLFIYAKSRKLIDKFVFIGNKTLNNRFLLDSLRYFDIKIGDVYNYRNMLDFINYINFYYRNIGKYNFFLKYFRIPLRNHNFLLKFKFFEGKYLKINRIRFIDDELKVYHNISSFYSFKKNNNLGKSFILNFSNLYYLSKYFDYIKSIYLDYGYLDFNCRIFRINVLKNKSLDLFFKLNTGKRYELSNIDISVENTNFKYYFNKLQRILFLDKYYNFNDVRIFYKRALNYLTNRGYLKSKINMSLVKERHRRVRLLIDIDLDRIFYFGKLSLNNISLLKQEELKGIIPYYFGKLYKEDLIDVGRNNLLKTGFFKKVIVKTKVIVNDDYYLVNVIYVLTKNSNGMLNFNVGYSDKKKINYEISFSKENLLTLGSELVVNVNKSDDLYSGNVSWLYLHDYKRNISIKHKLFFNNLSNIENNGYGYSNFNLGFKNKVILIPDNNTIYHLGLDYVHNHLLSDKMHLSLYRYVSAIDKSFLHDLKDLNSKLFLSDFYIKSRIIVDELDKNVFPTFGNYFDFNSKISIPFISSSSSFYKFLINFSKYFYISEEKDILMFLSGSFGYGESFNNRNFPFFENFHFINKHLRGFDLNSIEPNIIYMSTKLNRCKNGAQLCLSNDLLGGNVIGTLNVEFILPVYKIFSEKNNNIFRFSIYLDSGIIYDNTWKNNRSTVRSNIPDISKRLLRLSTGVSFKINTPFGLLNMSYGYPLVKYQKDKIYNFRFNIGN